MFELPVQTLVTPLIAPGAAGTVFTDTVRVWAVEEPQLLFAVTVIFPLVEPATAVMEFVVELPVQPEGKDQV